MRVYDLVEETRLSGSEGGGEPTLSSYPYHHFKVAMLERDKFSCE